MFEPDFGSTKSVNSRTLCLIGAPWPGAGMQRRVELGNVGWHFLVKKDTIAQVKVEGSRSEP